MRSCANIVLVFLGSVCSAVAMGGGRPLSSFDELLSMAVLTASWWMLLIGRLVAGVAERQLFLGSCLIAAGHIPTLSIAKTYELSLHVNRPTYG